MKTFHIVITTAVAMAGLVGFGRNEIKSKMTLPRNAPLCTVYNDTVPKKMVYRDLNTGETIDIWYDKVGMRTLNKRSGSPVEFYINTATNDTVFGRGRFIVNDYIVKGEDGKWKLNDAKVEVDGDELKVKAGDRKFKIDGGDVKIKGKGVKVKSDEP